MDFIEEREIKWIQIWKKNKIITADDMILYLENLIEAYQKMLELTNEFGKVARYKINT